MKTTSIWTTRDDRDLAALLTSASQGDLIGALLAVEGADEAAAERCRLQLTIWARDAAERPGDRVDALKAVLADEAELSGDTGDYYRVENSLISQVIARRRGLPITLSALWIEVARQIGADAEGVGLPGHFIARIDGHLVDPFDKGRRLSPEGCAAIVARLSNDTLPWDSAWLEPASPATIIERTLRNLLNVYNRQGVAVPMYRVGRLIAAICPSPPNRFVHARIAEALGASRLALDLYTALIKDHPEADESMIAGERLGPLLERTSMLN